MSRKVGTESRRTYQEKLSNGFFDKYMSGNGLDMGYSGYEKGVESILPTAIGVDIGYPGYDGVHLPFDSNSQDYVYSSHCLEHVTDYSGTIEEWHRVLKPGGYMIIIVPHQYLYEKKHSLPSSWNDDHKRFYTPGALLIDIENVLAPNTYRIKLLEDGDAGFDYSIGPDRHSDGQYEITLVLQKIQQPSWSLK